MASMTEFRKHIDRVYYRFGKLSAERKDLDATSVSNEAETEAVETRQDYKVSISSNPEFIFAELTLTADSEIFNIEVLVSGRWELQDSAPNDKELRRTFGQTIALPRLAAIAEAKTAELARQIDVPLPVFTFALDNMFLDDIAEPEE